MDEIVDKASNNMKESIAKLKKDLAKVRTGRAQTSLLDSVLVNCYDKSMHISSVASVSAPTAQCLEVQVWDAAVVANVEKAIRESNLDLTPNIAGQLIRVNIPPLTQERRESLVKIVAHHGENAKIHVRQIRKDSKDEVKKSTLSEDKMNFYNDKIQVIVDKTIKEIIEIVSSKKDELLKH